MKIKGLIISLGLLFILTSVMVISVVTSLAQDSGVETTNSASNSDTLLFAANCSLAQDDATIEKNKYFKSNLSTEAAMTLYHKTINEKFNKYIRKMMSEEDPDNGKPPEDDICEGTENYSTYCVAMDLLNNPEYGYMAYKKALTCRKYSLFEDATDRDEWAAYSDFMIYGEGNEQTVQDIYQTQRVLQISARLDGIENEIDAAKQTLDQTLSAYDSLKTAWKMHVKYMQIYESLVKYRDKLVEVRHQVEFFPAKFIDATTTSCT